MREMGIRMVLGADTRQILRLVVREGMLVVGARRPHPEGRGPSVRAGN